MDPAKRPEADEGEETGADELSPAVTFPFLPGVYLGLNAIRDARMVVEGPDCTYMKAQYVQGNHDLFSTLTTVSGWHRIVNTALYPSSVIASREEPIRALLEKVAAHSSTGGVFLASMPMAFVTGADYERICEEVAEKTGKEVVAVRGLSLRGDWLDGYAEVQRALARGLRLPEVEGPLDPRKVAMVGYLRDRNEADHDANLAEIRGLLEALGLELVCTWLDGGNFSGLFEVAKAGTILSLPYGRQAAKILSRRTGAGLIELPLPLGIDATELWALRLGEEFGAKEQAEAYVSANLSKIGPRLEWLVTTVFQNLGVAYVGDPHMLPGIVSLLEMVGARIHYAVITNREAHLREVEGLRERIPMLVRPRQAKLGKFREGFSKKKVHLMIGNSAGLSAADQSSALFEMGFPSLYTRAIYEKPFLGFGGALALLGDMANVVRMQEVHMSRAGENAIRGSAESGRRM